MLKLAVGVALAAVATSCAPSQVGSTPTPGATTVTTARPVEHWTMPNLVGSGLQDAQDAIQKLTGNVVFFTSSHDVSGQGRHQILDRNWKVCDQNIAAGQQIQVGVKIDFGVVKTTEKCP
ncbi:PASTA domain-containing protein [Kutzneria sp. NPDC052558]|uniref:PASTA domain-containing protein n=1 Tax=Kutzneria sp. NPDC052558 TaxID=3364121 RepID=UPI0037CCB4D3